MKEIINENYESINNDKDDCDCKREEKCKDNCIRKESIFFSGLCNPKDFDIDNGLWTEEGVSGSVHVPLKKPEIEEIDSVNAKIEIINKKVIVTLGVEGVDIYNYEGKIATGRKLIIEGLVCLTISYVSNKKDQSVHSFHGKVPFSAFIVLPNKCKEEDPLNNNFIVSSCIEDICIKSICDRTVKLTVTFALKANKSAMSCDKKFLSDSGIDCNKNNLDDKKECKDCIENNKPVISGICSEEKIKDLLKAKNDKCPTSYPKLWTEISVPEVLNISFMKPDIKQILSVNSELKILCQKVINTPISEGANLENLNLTGKKIVIEAVLEQRITYVSKSNCNSVHAEHFKVPVSAYIVAPKGVELTDKFKIVSCIEDIFVCILNDRQIFKNSTIFFKAIPIKCEK